MARIDLSSDVTVSAANTLDDSERARAARFRREEDRRAFVQSHLFRREILARYLRCHPSALRFKELEHQKPKLAMSGGEHRLKFNMAHSADIAVSAVSWDCEVGVDVERVTAHFDVDELAPQVLSATERAVLKDLSAEAARDAFFRAWTRKEAVLKAAGVGLSVSPTSLEVLPVEVRSVRLGSQQWWVSDLEMGSAYRGAIAGARGDLKLNCWSVVTRD